MKILDKVLKLGDAKAVHVIAIIFRVQGFFLDVKKLEHDVLTRLL